MKPVAIFRHSPTEGPGYFATYLDSRDLPWRLLEIDRGQAVPTRTENFSGLVFMGGPMSVNDDLPWIAPVLELIRRAVAADVPVLGHCLGGQLMSKARVMESPVDAIEVGRATDEACTGVSATILLKRTGRARRATRMRILL